MPELKENGEKQVWIQALQTLAEKDIAFKKDIYTKIRGIRKRQIISIMLASSVLVIITITLFITLSNLNNMSMLIKALSEGFNSLK